MASRFAYLKYVDLMYHEVISQPRNPNVTKEFCSSHIEILVPRLTVNTEFFTNHVGISSSSLSKFNIENIKIK